MPENPPTPTDEPDEPEQEPQEPLPGRLGDRCPQHRELGARLREMNERSRGAGGLK